ncbi:MAG TPA: riboflavin synthase [Actinomycetota bacterium]
MFTGIVEGQGTVTALRFAPHGSAAVVEVEAGWLDSTLRVGDSVAVNGCCLTATRVTGTGGDGAAGSGSGSGSGFAADVMAETLRRTALGRLAPGARVNLERPLALGERLGGHLVQGHVDGLGTLLERRPGGQGSEVLRFGLDPALARYLVEKGSVALDGVSLTVAAARPDWFEVALIPHTLAVTTLGPLAPGGVVNLEVDLLAKYVERLLQPHVEPRAAGTGTGTEVAR